MDQSQLLQLQQGCEHLVCDWSDVFERKRLELVLLEEIIQILLQHLENEAGVVFVREALVGSNKVEFVCIFLAETETC